METKFLQTLNTLSQQITLIDRDDGKTKQTLEKASSVAFVQRKISASSCMANSHLG